VLGKVALLEMDALVVAALRAVSGALFLSAASRILSPAEARFSAPDRRELMLLSLFGIAGNQVLFILGLARTTATNAGLLSVSTPVFVLILVSCFGTARPPVRRVLGVPVALSGVLLLLDLGHLRFGDATVSGDLLVVGNSLSYSIFLVRARGILRRHSAIAVTAGLFRYGAVPIVLLALPRLSRLRPQALSAATWGALAGIVVFATVVAYVLNAWGLSRTDATTAAVFVYVQPLIAGTLSWLFLGERPGPRTGVAAALIFAGVALTTWPARRERL